MRRELVRLIFKFLIWALSSFFRLARMVLFLSATSITSLIVGVPTAVERITDSWIQQATNSGQPWAYNPDLREGLKGLAYIILIMGWISTILLVIFIIRLLVWAN